MGSYQILMQFDINADPAVVRRAITTEEGIASWWSRQTSGPRDGELRVGFPDVPQPFEFSVDDGREAADVGATDAGPSRIEWRTGGFPPWWVGTTIRWDVGPNPEAGGTRLLFSHAGYDPDNPVIPIVTPAWAQIIDRLKGYAETGTANPFFDF
jgi:uncharacterized protein YndB with AHSA1/START domain